MNNTRVGWVSEPDGRSTAGLVCSCLFTIILSTWTACYPNVSKTPSEALKDKILETVVFVFAPEFLVSYAVTDWIGAKRLQFTCPILLAEEVYFLSLARFR